MNQRILNKLTAQEGTVSFYYKNLATGDSAALLPDEPMLAASVIKLFVLTEAFRRFEEGSLCLLLAGL